MGTPEFAVPCLKALCEKGENVTAVFTQPDRPKGRGNKMTPPPVKEYALEKGIPVYQPVSLRKGEEAEEAVNTLKELSPELIVVVAYGQILTKEILDIPKHFCVNIHASLLPKYRGAGPIQHCILNGETETGVTSMIMGEGLDTGDMLLKSSLTIGENETADELHDRLAELGAKTLTDTVEAIKAGNISPVPQNDADSCYAPKLTKELSPLDFTLPAAQVHNKIRGLSSWPCAQTEINGRLLKIYRSELDGVHYDKPAGTFICEKGRITAVCGDGHAVAFTEVQAQGGKRMKTADFLRGNKL